METHRDEAEGTKWIRHQVWWIQHEESPGWYILSFDEDDECNYDAAGPYETLELARKLAAEANNEDPDPYFTDLDKRRMRSEDE